MRSLYFFILLGFVLSCSEIIEVPDISDITVNVLAPINGAVLNTTNVSFTWDDVEDAESYRLQIANPNFENAIQIPVDSTLTETNFTTTLDIGNYEWRIQALNSGYQTSYTTQSLTIEE